MAVNDSRSMNADMQQGTVDSTYISIAPDRGGNPDVIPVERLGQPQYRNAEKFCDPPHVEAHVQHALRPVERKTAFGTDPRF
jgi:hypothetical protein